MRMDKELGVYLAQTLTSVLGTLRDVNHKLQAFEQAIQDHDPGLFDDYVERLDVVRSRDVSGMLLATAAERLTALFGKL